MRRYAIYLAPEPGSALDLLAKAWFGDDTTGGDAVPPSVTPGLAPERWAEITAAARHYGLHATLKAPFELAAGASPAQLRAAIAALAGRWSPLELHLELDDLDGFLALVLALPSPRLEGLAAAAVTELDRFRAPLTPFDRQRRLASARSPLEVEHIARWGYPFVLDRFTFHMTLTARLAELERSMLRDALRALTAPVVGKAQMFRHICLFQQPDRSAPFALTDRFELAAEPEHAAPCA